MHRGYVKLWRKVTDSGILSNPEASQLFLYLISKASHKGRRQIIGTSMVTLAPGELVVGRKQLAAELRSTEQKIRTAINVLKSNQVITTKPTNKFTVVSFVNWHIYQGPETREQPTNNQQNASIQPALNQDSTTNKN